LFFSGGLRKRQQFRVISSLKVRNVKGKSAAGKPLEFITGTARNLHEDGFPQYRTLRDCGVSKDIHISCKLAPNLNWFWETLWKERLKVRFFLLNLLTVSSPDDFRTHLTA
jgi:hypothetical protein